MKSESETKSSRFLQIFVWLLQAHRLCRTCWLLVHPNVTLIRQFWLDEISNKTITVFCIDQYKFVWTLEINIHLSLKASVNIVFKVHKNSYWVTLIRQFWLDEISHYLYVHWSNRNRIHVILFIDFVRKRNWNQVKKRL
jgi:hypothetical protein